MQLRWASRRRTTQPILCCSLAVQGIATRRDITQESQLRLAGSCIFDLLLGAGMQHSGSQAGKGEKVSDWPMEGSGRGRF